MTDMTGMQLEAAREDLESAAASILGQMLFAFSRLDVEIGLLLVWSGEGRQVEELTKKVADYSFHKKLTFLEELVNSKYTKNSKVHSEYPKWLEDAHKTRVTRNQLVHGRWGIDPSQKQVINVVGLPTSVDQSEFRYSISDLEQELDRINHLQLLLQKLRRRWPL